MEDIMKTKLLLILGLLLIVVLMGLAGCSSQGVTAADNPITVNVGGQQTGIAVNGEGRVTVTPDICSLTLGVSAQALTVADATTQAAAGMIRVMDALKAKGIADKDIKTQYYSIQQRTRWDDKIQLSVVIGYTVSNTVVAKIRDTARAGSIIDSVAVAGGDLTRINGISFSVDNPSNYYTQARELAIKDAKAKADQMAKLVGVTLGKVTSITESSYAPSQPYPVMYKAAGMADSASTTPISAGDTEIVLTVQINYAIQ
jgi:uncharacterized protein YggE